MPILYATVARGSNVLAEYAARSGNFSQLAKQLLQKLTATNSRQTYTFEQHFIHYMVVDGIVFLCISDDKTNRSMAFSFLEKVKAQFQQTYPNPKDAIAYAYQTDFSRVLRQHMDYYSNDANADRISRVHNQINEVKDIMVENIDKVLQRGERIELLMDKTDNLAQNAMTFQKKSTALKRAMWFKNIKLIIIIIVVVIVIAYIIAASVCKSPIFLGCINQNQSPGAPPTEAPVAPPHAPGTPGTPGTLFV